MRHSRYVATKNSLVGVVFRKHNHRAGWGLRLYVRVGGFRRWLDIGWFHGPDVRL